MTYRTNARPPTVETVRSFTRYHTEHIPKGGGLGILLIMILPAVAVASRAQSLWGIGAVLTPIALLTVALLRNDEWTGRVYDVDDSGIYEDGVLTPFHDIASVRLDATAHRTWVTVCRTDGTTLRCNVSNPLGMHRDVTKRLNQLAEERLTTLTTER